MTGKLLGSSDIERSVSGTHEIVLLHTLSGEIIAASAAAAKLLGYSEEELKQIYMANIRPKALRFADVLKVNKDQDAAVVFMRRNGRRFSARVTSSTIYAMLSAEPLELVRLHLELINSPENVEDESPQINYQESAGLLSLVNHDIAAPVAEFMEVLDLFEASRLDDKQLQLHGRLKKISRTMDRYVSDVEDVFKLGVNQLQLDPMPFNLIETIDELIDGQENRFTAENVEFSVCVADNVPELVFGDKERVKQVLNDLLQAAMSMSQTGELKLRIKPRGNESQIASVGFMLEFPQTMIDVEQLKQDKTRRVDTGARKKGGGQSFGVKFAIAKKLLKLMDGELVFNQRDDGVSDFSFDMHLPEVHNLDLMGKLHFFEGKKLMLVEDNLSLMYEQLSRWGARVETFSDVQEAVEYLDASASEDRPDLIILNAGVSGKLLADQDVIPNKLSGLHDAAGDRPVVVVKPRLSSVCDRRTVALEAPYRIGRVANHFANLLSLDIPYPYANNSRQRQLKFSPGKPRVLLVASEAFERDSLQEIVEAAGYAVDLAFNGIDAMFACERQHYALIVLDVDMPHMDGVVSCTHIRRTPESDNSMTPIVALSRSVSENVKLELANVGVYSLLEKPVDATLLTSTMRQCFLQEAQGDDSLHGSVGGQAQSDREIFAAKRMRFNDQVQGRTSFSDIMVNDDVLGRLIVDSNVDACMEMIDIFMQESSDSLQVIHKACEEGNFVVVAQEAHAIKSAARTFGCDSLHDLVSHLNREAKENNIAECHWLATELPAVFQSSCTLLQRFQTNFRKERVNS